MSFLHACSLQRSASAPVAETFAVALQIVVVPASNSEFVVTFAVFVVAFASIAKRTLMCLPPHYQAYHKSYGSTLRLTPLLRFVEFFVFLLPL